MIGSSENSVSYNGNGVTTEFPFRFKILNKTDLKVLIVDEFNKETAILKDFYIDMENSLVYYPGYSPGAEPPVEEQPPKLQEGQRLVIYRDVPITQETALDEHWPFNVIEGMADKLTIIAQQIAAANQRTFQLSVALENWSKINLQLPYSPGKSFAWNKEGTGLELTENPADVLPKVQQEANDLREYVVFKTQEITELVASLNSLTREELQKLRDQCEDYAYNAEQSALLNTRWPVSISRTRPIWKNNYDIEDQDLILTVPKVIKINVLKE